MSNGQKKKFKNANMCDHKIFLSHISFLQCIFAKYVAMLHIVFDYEKSLLVLEKWKVDV